MDFGEDGIRRCGTGERMGVGGRDANVLVDFLEQLLHAAKRSATNGPLRNPVEPNLHLIQPRGIGRSEMHMEARPCCEPTFYPRMFVRPVVIHDHVDVQLCGHVLLNLSQEIQICLMLMALPALRNHRAFRRVQGRKECRRSVTPVIVRYALDIAEPHRQHRLGAFERLNLALFIYAQNHSIFRWIQVQPYNIPYFLYEKWIGRELELFLPVRLQPEGLPDAVYGRFRHARLFGDLPDTPVRAVFRFRLQRLANQLRHTLVTDRSWATRAQLVMQPGHILLQKSLPPLAHRRVGQSHLARDLHVRLSGSTQQNNPGPSDHPRRKRSRTPEAFEPFTLLRTQNQRRFRPSHRHRHPPFCTRDAYIPSNTIATYLRDRTLGETHGED